MIEARIPRSEYNERWERTQQAARSAGLDGLVVWSRGGATVDSYADVFYLSNHYTLFPLVRDRPPLWAGMSAAAVVLAVDGEPTLIVDVPDWRQDLVVVEDTRPTNDIPALVARVLREKRINDGRVGLVGGTTMLVSSYRLLVNHVPDAELIPQDDLIESLRVHKSAIELDLLREAAAVGGEVITAALTTALRPGSSEAAAAAAGYAVGVAQGAAMYDLALSSGPFSDYYAYGRLPSWTKRTLEHGDLFHIDTYGAVNGYLFDFARSCVVGGDPTADQRHVLDGTIAAVQAGVEAIRPSIPASNVFHAVRGVLADRGMDAGHGVGHVDDSGRLEIQDFGIGVHGHSVGLGWEAPWIIADERTPLEAGMCIAIEATAGLDGVGSACFEQMVILHDDGPELITTIPETYW